MLRRWNAWGSLCSQPRSTRRWSTIIAARSKWVLVPAAIWYHLKAIVLWGLNINKNSFCSCGWLRLSGSPHFNCPIYRKGVTKTLGTSGLNTISPLLSDTVICCLLFNAKIAPDKVKQTRKTLFKAIAVWERGQRWVQTELCWNKRQESF